MGSNLDGTFGVGDTKMILEYLYAYLGMFSQYFGLPHSLLLHQCSISSITDIIHV
jgi:hypothetical protein